MADLRDFTGKNRKFTGTIGERISTGTTAQRDDATFGAGTLRFNTSTNLMEYYTGTEWKSIDAPPTITSFAVDGGSPITSTFFGNTSSVVTIAINGSLFDTTNGTVLFVGTGGGDISPLTTVRNSSSLMTVTVNTNSFNGTYEPYDIKVTNGSGLFALLENCIVSDTAPIFTTASGTLGSIFDTARSSYSLSTAAATDPDGDTITYSITSGALPTGLSLNSSTAAITGTASAVVTDTTSTFTVRAATATQNSSRSFSITVKAPVVESFTSTGSFTFNVPSGITSVRALVIGGGGSGGTQVGGGGGAGGMVEIASYPVSPAGTVTGNIGIGGEGFPTGGGPGPGNFATPGTNTVFGNITALGGGAGGNHSGPQPQSGQSGGSGGGGGSSGGQQPGGGATQGPSGGGTGYGSAGGHGHVGWSGGGGGGAGGGGQNASGGGTGGVGGDGRSNNITGSSVTYAGGGGGGQPGGTRPGGSGGGGTGGDASVGGVPGTNSLGAGGGGVRDASAGAGDGGNGVVIVTY
jgi:hypothetical protein